MNFHLACFGVVAAVSSFAPPIGAQTSAPSSEEHRNAAYTAHQADFDYLLGDWEFSAESKQYGTFTGRWSAVLLETGQIIDEYRVLGGSGETVHVTSTIRSYDSAAERWELIGMDRGGGLLDFGTAQRVGDEMHLEQKFGVAGGRPVTLRIRYYDIRPDRFSWSADRSTDDGKTWTADFQRIEARRIGPARSLGALARAPRARK
jgi:hypothetical protein